MTLRHKIMTEWGHARREAVTTNNLVRMRRTNDTGIDQRIETFNGEL